MTKNFQKFQRIRPKTLGQKDLWDALHEKDIQYVAISGPPGTGKSFLTCYYAAKELEKNPNIEKISICRSVTPIKGEEIGFLKGGVGEKMAEWLVPMTSNLKTFLPDYGEYVYKGAIEVIPLAMARGRSFEYTVVIADEAQNLSLETFEMLLTRIADSSKLIVLGDFKQNDRRGDTTDFEKVCGALDGMDAFKWIQLDWEDCIRSKNIREISERLDEII